MVFFFLNNFSCICKYSLQYGISNSLIKLQSNNTSTTTSTIPNHPPVVNAGPNQIVNENATVALVGVGIDSDPMNTLRYLWRQIDGPAMS